MNTSIICPATLLSDQEMLFSATEGQVLRALAGQVAELAARPVEQEKRQLWLDHNALRPTRPVVFCDPETSWSEIIPPDTLQCTNPIARAWEFNLRREIFWGAEMQDDRVVMPVFDVPHVHHDPDWGVAERMIDTGLLEHGDRTAYTWEAPVQTEADWDKIRTAPLLRVDFAATERLVALATRLFGDLLSVRQKTQWWWSLGMTWQLIKLRGLETFMYDLAENPAFVHRMMATLRDGTLAMVDALDQAGLLGLNWDGSYVGSGGYGWTEELPGQNFDGTPHTHNLWGFAESQETVGVSPRMFETFIFPYQLPLLAKFGLNCYGCCEPVDKRWKVLRTIPNLRRVSVSPWSNIERMAEYLSTDYILSRKPNPADLAMEFFDEERIRADLRREMEITRGCRVEVIMKDVTTMLHDPSRATRWVQIALEEARRV